MARTRRTARTASPSCSAARSAAATGAASRSIPQLGYLFVNTSNLATIGRMVPGPASRSIATSCAYTRFWDDNKYPCQQPPWGELVAVNVEHRRHRVEDPVRDLSGARREGHSADRHAQSRRPDRDRERPRVHRRDQGRALPRLRREDRQGAVVRAARGRRRRDADDVHGPQRQAVRRHRRRRPRRHRSRRHGRCTRRSSSRSRCRIARPPHPLLPRPRHRHPRPHRRRRVRARHQPCRWKRDARWPSASAPRVTALARTSPPGRTPDAWKKVVEEMVSMGAQGAPDNLRIVAEYLSQAYPAKK